MNNKDYEDIYNRLKENSIGSDKICEDKRYKRQCKLNKTIALLMCTLATCAVVRSYSKSINMTPVNIHNEATVQIETDTYKPVYFIEYDYDIYEMTIIEMKRLDSLLEKSGLTEYTRDGKLRNYNYTVADYQKIEGLDESYISAFSCVANEKSLNEFLKVFGYENIESYVRSKGFVDNKGNVDITSWEINCLNELGQQLAKEAGETKTR